MKKEICIELIKNKDYGFLNFIYMYNYEWLYKFSCYVAKYILKNIKLEFEDVKYFIYNAINKIFNIKIETIEKYWLKPLLKFLIKQEIFMFARYLKNNKNQILNKSFEINNILTTNNIDNDNINYINEYNNKYDLEQLLLLNNDKINMLTKLDKQIIYFYYFNNYKVKKISMFLNCQEIIVQNSLKKIKKIFKSFKLH